MSRRKFTSVWDAIETAPSQAASLKARAKVMIALQERIRADGLTQAAAARRLGVTQPRVSDLMRGRIDLFSLDTLIDLCAGVGLDVRISLREAA